jgi:hypothetical protein
MRIRGTASHLVCGSYCDDIYCPYGGVLLAKETGIGAPTLVVWTFMDDFLSVMSNVLEENKKVITTA